MGESMRVSEHVLRLAGLLPPNEAEQITVEGKQGAAQSDLISHVFGKPYTAGNRTIIPVARVRFVSPPGSGPKRMSDAENSRPRKHKMPRAARFWKMGGVYGMSTPVALVEISEKGVRVRPVFDTLPVILGGMLLGAWNVYWIMRAIREWRC